jgi:hypothetical protein
MATPILYNTTMTLKRRTLTVSRGRVTADTSADLGPFQASVQVDRQGRNTRIQSSGNRQHTYLKVYVQSTDARPADQFGEDASDNATFSILPGETYRVLSVGKYAGDLTGSVTLPHEILRLVRIDEGGKEI